MTSRIIVNNIQSDTGIATVTFNSNISVNGAISSTGISTFSNGIVVSAGSTSTPSISPVGDSNTGIFFPSADTVCIGEGGTEALRVNSSGNVGIGTDNPGDKLQVNTSSGGGIRISDGSVTGLFGSGSGPVTRLYSITNHDLILGTNDIERVRVDTSGRVRMPYQTAIELNGNNGADIDFTGNAQLLTSTYYNQTISRGGMGWNSSTGAITVPVTGYYFLTGFFYCNTAGNGEGRIQIRINGSNNVVFQMRAVGTNTFTLVRSLAANDTIDVIADSFDLPRLYMGPQHTRFAVFLLG